MNNAIIFWSVLSVSLLVALASLFYLNRSKSLSYIDFALFVLPFVAWWSLALSNFRSKALANLIEPIGLFIFLSAVIFMRTFIITYGTNKQRSITSLIIDVLFAVLIYAFIPALPE
jgi:hypothetical protein